MAEAAAKADTTVSVSGKSFLQFIGMIFGRLLGIIGLILVIAILFVGIKVGINYYKTGQSSVAVAHIEATSAQPVGFIESAIYKISPDLYALYTGRQTSALAYDYEVEQNAENKRLGVRINDFVPIKSVYLEGEPLKFTGSITASGIGEEMNIEAYCLLQGYNSDFPIPARVLGTNTIDNKAVVFKNQETEFNVQCDFPGQTITKLKEGKVAELVVVYEFTTKANQKVYFLDSKVYSNLVRDQGLNPFKYYNLQDPLLDSRGRIKSKSTVAPLALVLGVDVPQPLTDANPDYGNANNIYQLTVQLEPSAGWLGELEALRDLQVQVPDVRDLAITLEGDSDFSAVGSSSCDFQYAGPGAQGFKIYKVKSEKLTDVNKDCSVRSLRGLALSTSECIDLFKSRPTFLCNFKVLRVPERGMQYDFIRAQADYIHKVNRKSAIEIRKRPELPASQPTV